MITLTNITLQRIHSAAYKKLYEELAKPWRYTADVIEMSGASLPVSVSTDSSFNIGLLEQAQQMGVRMAGFEVTQQLPAKSMHNLVKWQEDVKWAMRSHNVKYVGGINEWQRREMVRVLQEAVDKHQTPKAIADSFLSAGLQLSRVRADRIAVTEGTRAAAMATMLAANDFGFEMEKRWVSSHDNKVRTLRNSRFNHNIAVEDAKDMLDVWFNGEAIMYPGDPRCSPGNTVNCRCTLALTAKRDAEGNLIPKRVRVSNRQMLTGLLIGATAALIADMIREIFE